MIKTESELKKSLAQCIEGAIYNFKKEHPDVIFLQPPTSHFSLVKRIVGQVYNWHKRNEKEN